LFALHLRSLGYAADPELDSDMLDPIASYDSFVVAELDGSLVAMGGIARGEIRRIFVMPEHRAHGLGARIVSELVSAARASGEREIRAVIAGSNASARRLFTSLGFRPTGRAPEHRQMQHCEIFDGSEACRSSKRT
jgi:ribosomal protein S18 acetylase RimI-like enzyme